MGSSGAGKTRLMNAISDRIKTDKNNILSGSILVNDQIKMTGEVFGMHGKYVMQDDVLFNYFSPEEALTFAARLRLKCSLEEQDRRVQTLIRDLGLTRCA